MGFTLPTELKTAAAEALNFIFDAYKRSDPVYFYKTPSKVIATKDPNFIAGFQQPHQGSNSVTETAQRLEFEARVIFLQDQPIRTFISGDGNLQAKFKAPATRIKIQVKEAGKTALADVEAIEFDGIKYRIDEGPRALGIFDEITLYQFVFTREN